MQRGSLPELDWEEGLTEPPALGRISTSWDGSVPLSWPRFPVTLWVSPLHYRDEARVTLPSPPIGVWIGCVHRSLPVQNTIFPQLTGLAAPHPSGLTGLPHPR